MLFQLPLCIYRLVVPWVPLQSLVQELVGKYHLFWPTLIAERRTTFVQESEKMQVSNMGSQQSQVEESGTSPKEEQRQHQEL